MYKDYKFFYKNYLLGMYKDSTFFHKDYFGIR